MLLGLPVIGRIECVAKRLASLQNRCPQLGAISLRMPTSSCGILPLRTISSTSSISPDA
jgi:hypothetical protein